MKFTVRNEFSDSAAKASRAVAKKQLAKSLKAHLEFINQICKEDLFLEFSSTHRKKLKVVVEGTAAELCSKQEVLYYFSWVLNDLPKLVEAYRPFIGMRDAKRQKPWSVVTALDRALGSLKLVHTLTRLFDCAAKVKPGPLKSLIERCKSDPDKKKLLEKLTEYLQSGSTIVPRGHLRDYRKLFTEIRSPIYKELESLF